MELILKETIDTLGQEGDIVKVKPGYARNFLLPKAKAVVADKANLAILEQSRAAIESRRQEQKAAAEAMSKKIAGVTIEIAQRVGEGDRLYGSVTAADINAGLAAKGIEIEKRHILLEEPIKTLGETKVRVKVGYQMVAEMTVKIVPLTDAEPEAVAEKPQADKE